MYPRWNVPRSVPENRIFLRVFAIFGGLLLALTVLYGLLIIPLQRDSLLKVLYSQASTVSISIIQACSEAMLTDDFGFIVEHNLQVLHNDKGIESVRIVPRQGATLYITPAGWRTLDRKEARVRPSDFEKESFGIVDVAGSNSYYRFVTPIRFSGLTWGAMSIDFNTSDYDANIESMYHQLFLISGLALMSMMPIGYFFARWLTRPISIISEAATRVARGDLSAHVHIHRNDEIGRLSYSFNKMVDALAQNRHQMENINQELEIKVAERTQALDTLNQTLDNRVHDEIAKRQAQEQILIHQSRLAAMGEMIGAIAHQWRQPLNALSLVLQNIQLQYRMGQLSDESMQRLQVKADQLILHMSRTIDEFRNFFKPSKIKETFVLAQALHSAANILEGTFKNNNIELNIDCSDDLQLTGVPGEFAQVILNLLSNAKDSVLSAGQAPARILIHANMVAQFIRIDVEDNGSGIDLAILHKIYEPYFTTKEEGKGTGIGLYMSKMIIENNMNGRLEACALPQGARFSILLPCVPAQPTPQDPGLDEREHRAVTLEDS